VRSGMRKVEASITRETLKTAHPKSLIAKVADVAQLVEQPIRNALSLAYVVVEYGGLRVVLGGSRVSLSTVCTAFCTAI
jgi:hypothetical protein